MWLNENAGVLVLVLGIAAIALSCAVLFFVLSLRSRLAVQRLKFVGMYSADPDTHEVYASLTVGNRSVNEVAVKELGIRNGGVAFDFTALYREKAGLDARTHIVIEQRHSIGLKLSVAELGRVLTDGGKLGTLRMYALDLTGNLYEGRIGAVRRLLAERRKGAPQAERGTSVSLEEQKTPPDQGAADDDAHPPRPE